MRIFLKKWLTNSGRVQVIFALLYLLTTFGIPLSHTCQLVDKNVHPRHSECSSRLLHSESDVETQHATVLNQSSLTETYRLHCPACLFSLTSKAFRARSNVSLCSTQTVVRTHILPQWDSIKQLEWFCSAPLRAPPSITS